MKMDNTMWSVLKNDDKSISIENKYSNHDVVFTSIYGRYSSIRMSLNDFELLKKTCLKYLTFKLTNRQVNRYINSGENFYFQINSYSINPIEEYVIKIFHKIFFE